MAAAPVLGEPLENSFESKFLVEDDISKKHGPILISLNVQAHRGQPDSFTSAYRRRDPLENSGSISFSVGSSLVCHL